MSISRKKKFHKNPFLEVKLLGLHEYASKCMSQLISLGLYSSRRNKIVLFLITHTSPQVSVFQR